MRVLHRHRDTDDNDAVVAEAERPPRPLLPSTPVHVRRTGEGVVHLVLAEARRRNVLGRSTITAIESAVRDLGDKDRVVLITAEGPDFCAGYDLREAAGGDPESLIAHESNFAPLRRAAVPVIAALQGNVIGGGLELALAADVRLAAPDLRMSIPANRLGLVYSLQGVALLVAELGESVTRAMLLAGRVLDAEEARRLGLVSEVVDAEDLEQRGLELAHEMASWAPEATAGNRRVLDIVTGRVIDDAAALRLASFRPEGRLAGSISRFAAPPQRRRTLRALRARLRHPRG